MQHIVQALKPHRAGWSEFFADMGVFLDWCSLYQKDPALFDEHETPEAKGAGGRTFVEELKAGSAHYGGVAYEASRTAEENAAFRRALHSTADVWYTHKMIVTLFVTRPPRGGFQGRNYEQCCGWTFFKRSSTELIKPARAYVVEAGKSSSEGRFLWSLTIDSVADADEARRPPLAPAAFAEQLQTMHFTNDADAAAVAELYEATATQVLRSTAGMELDYVPVREDDGVRVAQALALCEKVEELSWCFVTMPAVELRAMLAAAVPTLRRLHLQESALGEAGGVALGEALSKGATPQLQWLYLASNALGGAGAVALGEALGNGATPQLQRLDLDGNALGVAGGVALCEALSKGATPQLQALNLANNTLGKAGGVALGKALGNGATGSATPLLQELYLANSALGEAGAVALGEALGNGATPQLQALDLSNSALGEVGTVALGEALGQGATPQLQALVLHGNALGTRGAAALATTVSKKALPRLTMLHVGHKHLGASVRRMLNESARAMDGELEVVYDTREIVSEIPKLGIVENEQERGEHCANEQRGKLCSKCLTS